MADRIRRCSQRGHRRRAPARAARGRLCHRHIPAGAWDALAALVTGHGYQLTADAEGSDTRGHTNFTDKIVNIDPRYALAGRVHIRVHELGHIRCGHEHRRDISRAQRATEAESVAFIVCTVLGLAVGDVAAIYVGGWTDGNPDTITAPGRDPHRRPRPAGRPGRPAR